MCGIAGLAGKTSDRRAVLERISAGLVHRGPDESGTYNEAWVTLAIRRLSIIDVADGHQPYQNEQGSIHVVFNGEIYGFKRLRERLERAGTDSLPRPTAKSSPTPTRSTETASSLSSTGCSLLPSGTSAPAA